MRAELRGKPGARLPSLPLSQDGMSLHDAATNAASDMQIEDEVQISGRGSQLHPVRVLKEIFDRPKIPKRRPGVNRIAEKYKNVFNSASAGADRNAKRGMTAEQLPNSREYLSSPAFNNERLSHPTNMLGGDPANSTFYST